MAITYGFRRRKLARGLSSFSFSVGGSWSDSAGGASRFSVSSCSARILAAAAFRMASDAETQAGLAGPLGRLQDLLGIILPTVRRFAHHDPAAFAM